MFIGDNLSKIRNLFSVNQGTTTLNHISDEALKDACLGTNMTRDQRALLRIMVATINSPDNHEVEFLKPTEIMSDYGEAQIGKHLELFGVDLEATRKQVGGILGNVLSFKDNAVTVQTSTGSYSVFSGKVEPKIIGHEIFGHGRSLALGLTSDIDQHTIPVQVENLITRVMGGNIYYDGLKHSPLPHIELPYEKANAIPTKLY